MGGGQYGGTIGAGEAIGMVHLGIVSNGLAALDPSAAGRAGDGKPGLLLGVLARAAGAEFLALPEEELGVVHLEEDVVTAW